MMWTVTNTSITESSFGSSPSERVQAEGQGTESSVFGLLPEREQSGSFVAREATRETFLAKEVATPQSQTSTFDRLDRVALDAARRQRDSVLEAKETARAGLLMDVPNVAFLMTVDQMGRMSGQDLE